MAFGPETPTSPRFAAWRTALWIGLFLAAGLALRMAFSVDAAFDDETGRYMYTGNDPYYHDRTVHSILDTGEHLRFDPAINYPAGGYNPNPPLFDWTTAPVAVGFDALGAQDPVGLALNVMVAVWGALIVLPVYHIGRDLWGRRAGLWGAFFIAVSAPHIQRTIFGFADHDATTLFFIALAFSFMVKALQAVERREYVTDWRHVAAVRAGLRSAVSANRTAFLWSALAGTALTATAVTWKGYPYALAVMAIGIGVQLLNDHLRNRDSTAAFGLYLIPLAMVAVLPYLLFYRAFPTFLDTTVMPSLYVLLGVVVVGLVLVPTRQLPSILVFPVLIAAAVGGIVALKLFVPGVYTTISTGLGYFQQSKLYGTIAEAQRSELGYVAASFGFFSFILAFWGFGKLLKGTYRGDGAATLVASWSLVALFMAFAATRFILNAAPIFAILMGAATSGIVGKLGFAEVGRRFRARPGGVVGGAFGSLDGKSAIGASLVFLLLVVPNAWIGVDAAMPSEYEADHNLDRQYFGAFGISFEVRNDGWLPVMDELGDRDSCRSDPLAVCAPGDADYQPMEDRPAFIAWWDYGHWATGIALHPTVADPFQNHYNLAGRFLASESEREAVAWLTILLLNNDYAKN
ncbi:MAG TPA: STT3 domain-containing protein, partial [Candidatus Thermoplasmatota archaeon]|nr:STT3 domain-containing protein [Candidatus Thermoplasmatota archaeon]